MNEGPTALLGTMSSVFEGFEADFQGLASEVSRRISELSDPEIEQSCALCLVLVPGTLLTRGVRSSQTRD